MLLPPNATKQERTIIEAIDYKVDSSCIKGFKFSFKEELLPWLIEEYGLEEILRWVKNKRKAVEEGIKFQRLRGTLASLKIALKWANIDEITIIEEPPGKHFFELQIGIKDVPNDFFVDAAIELAKLSLPARSRLMRIFNDHYNVDRFILDESFFGSLLSDYSGIKIEKDGPVLSFGRINFCSSRGLLVEIVDNYLREHYEQAFNDDVYRLDVAVLGETEPHTKNYSGIYERSHLWYNFKALYSLPQSLLPPIKFAKAQIVLSDQLCFLKFFEFSFITTFVCNFVFYSSKKCIFDNKNPNLIIEKFCIKQQLLLRSYG
ncbi:phage tail protein [Wolbachia endosymbiont (group B) of Melanostoma mellinum]|uniref:phage tail protein n=1 Tax=Wolbachia endosymbiont (group B) of Melanostoma mellinum TaxID=2954030 RepID=UPI002232621B|nr:phage tail protein [Wolbachia endosymbiont (group B) of Melanostoma mellinum]